MCLNLEARKTNKQKLYFIQNAHFYFPVELFNKLISIQKDTFNHISSQTADTYPELRHRKEEPKKLPL